MERYVDLKLEEKAEVIIREMKEFWSEEKHQYEFPYREEVFAVVLTEEEAEKYAVQAVRVTEEILFLQRQGILQEEVRRFQEKMQEDYLDEKERSVWSVVIAYGKDTIYNRESFCRVIEEVGILNGNRIGSAAWMLMQRPVLASAVMAVMDSCCETIDIEDDKGYFLTAWYFLRSCLYIRSGRNG